MDKVTVIIPVHNAAQYIIRCLESIAIQNIDTEVILIDDCSTDNLTQVLFPAVTEIKLNNFTFIQMEKNIGPAEARNKGIKLATGNYIAFLDADDWWESGKLKEELKLIKEKDVPFVYTAKTNFYQGTNKIKYVECSEKLNITDILKNNEIVCSSVLIKTEVAKKYLMEHSELCEDYYTWIRILKDYDYVCGINKPYVNYTVRKDSLSGNKIKNAIKRYKTVKVAGYSFSERIHYFLIYMITGIKKFYIGKENRFENN